MTKQDDRDFPKLSLRVPPDLYQKLLEIQERPGKSKTTIVIEALTFHCMITEDLDQMSNFFTDWLESPIGIKWMKDYWQRHIDEYIDDKIDGKLRKMLELVSDC